MYKGQELNAVKWREKKLGLLHTLMRKVDLKSKLQANTKKLEWTQSKPRVDAKFQKADPG